MTEQEHTYPPVGHSMASAARFALVERMKKRAVEVRERAGHRQRETALVEALRSSLHGEVIDREHPAYDEARAVWNGLIDRRPAVIARCAGVEDAVAAVRLAREHRPVVSIRGGGHQVAGSAVSDDGLVIDLSTMREVSVNPDARLAGSPAEPGGQTSIAPPRPSAW